MGYCIESHKIDSDVGVRTTLILRKGSRLMGVNATRHPSFQIWLSLLVPEVPNLPGDHYETRIFSVVGAGWFLEAHVWTDLPDPPVTLAGKINMFYIGSVDATEEDQTPFGTGALRHVFEERDPSLKPTFEEP
jgi:hypothetical protein